MQVKGVIAFAGVVVLALSTAHGAVLTLADVPQNVSAELKALIEKTFSPDAAPRGRAAHSIGAMGAPAAPAVPFLIRLLADPEETNDSNYAVSLSALAALEKIGAPAVPPCVAALNSKPGIERLHLIDILGTIGNREALDALIPLIKGRDPELASRTISSLSKCKDPRMMGLLLDAMNCDDKWVRIAAVQVLAHFHDPKAVDRLLLALKDDDMEVRVDTCESLGEARERRAVPQLIEAMRQADADSHRLRAVAARSLGMIGDDSALGPLLNVLKDHGRRAGLRAAAAESLGLLGFREVLPPLTAIMNDEQEPYDLRSECLLAIAKLDGAASLPLMTSIATSPSKKNFLRFWASLEVLRATGGAIEDARLIVPLSEFEDWPGEGEGGIIRWNSRNSMLKEVVKNGKTEAVRSAAAKMLVPGYKAAKADRSAVDSVWAIGAAALFLFVGVGLYTRRFLRARSPKCAGRSPA